MAFQALLRLQALLEEQRPDAVQEVGRENRQAVLRQADLVERTLEDPQGGEGDGRGRYRLELEVEGDLGHDSGAGSRDGERWIPILLLHQQIEKSKTRIRQKSTSLHFEISQSRVSSRFFGALAIPDLILGGKMSGASTRPRRHTHGEH